jgi:hypothetical protein
MVTKTQEKYIDDCPCQSSWKAHYCPCPIFYLQEQEEELRKGFADWDNDIICMDCGFVTHSSRDMVEHMSNYGGERSSSENCDIVKIENLNSPQDGERRTKASDLYSSDVSVSHNVCLSDNSSTLEDKPNPSPPLSPNKTLVSGKGAVLCSKGCGERLVSSDDWHKCSYSKFCEEKT